MLPTEEAIELAQTVVEMVEAAPPGMIGAGAREKVIDSLKKDFLPGLTAKNPDSKMSDELAQAFTENPSLPGAIFDAFQWPWPFRSVLRHELMEIDRRRRGEPAKEPDGEPDVYEL